MAADQLQNDLANRRKLQPAIIQSTAVCSFGSTTKSTVTLSPSLLTAVSLALQNLCLMLLAIGTCVVRPPERSLGGRRPTNVLQPAGASPHYRML